MGEERLYRANSPNAPARCGGMDPTDQRAAEKGIPVFFIGGTDYGHGLQLISKNRRKMLFKVPGHTSSHRGMSTYIPAKFVMFTLNDDEPIDATEGEGTAVTFDIATKKELSTL